MKNQRQKWGHARVHPHIEKDHSSHQLQIFQSSLGSVSFNNGESLILHNAKRQVFKETDQTFLKQIRDMSDLQQNQILKFIKSGKVELTPTIYNELHYKATIHKNANIVNQNTKIQFKKLAHSDKCYCGCRRGKGKFFSYFTTNQQKLKVLGPGILLLFLFKRASIVMLLAGILIYSLFGFITNIMSNHADLTAKCESQPYCKFKIQASDENKSLDFVFHTAQRWLAVGFCLIWVLMLRALKYLGLQKNKVIDNKLRSASDFAIKIQNLPRGAYSESQLIGYMQQIWKRKLIQKIKTKNKQIQQNKQQSKSEIKNVQIAFDTRFQLKIKSIQIIYNMQFVRNLSGKITKLATEINDLLFQEGDSVGKVFVIQRQLYQKKKKQLLESYQLMNDFRKRFLNQPQFRKKISTTCCIMQFETQKRREAVISYFGTQKMGIWAQFLLSVKSCLRSADRSTLFYGNVLKIEKAPEPSDILWLNCQQPQSVPRRFGLFLVTILIIVLSFGAIFGLTYLKSDIQKHPYKYWQTLNSYINYVISFLMIGVNKISWQLMSILLNYAYYHTETQRIISLMRRVLIIQCINIIALPIFSNWIVYGVDSIYGNQGLAGLTFDYHISNITTTAKGLFNIVYILKVIALMIPWTRYKIIWWNIKNPTKIDQKKGQPEVNKFYQGMDFDIAENYIFILSATMHAAFFCRLQPILIFLNMSAILLLYLVNRYKIMRLCKIPGMTEYLVFDTALTFMALIPLFYGVGAVVIEYMSFLKNPQYTFTIQNCIPPIICAALGFIAFFNPGQILSKIVYTIIQKIIGSVMDTQQHQMDVDDIQQKSGSETDSIANEKDIMQEAAKENQKNSARIQSYYKQSNSLCLFGFQRVFRGESIRRQARELKKYCQSFFEKDQRQKNIQEIIVQANIDHQNDANQLDDDQEKSRVK